MDSQDFAKQHVSKALQIVEAAHSLELSLLPIFMEDTAQSGRIYSPKNVADCSVILASHLLWQAKYSNLSGEFLVLCAAVYTYVRNPDADTSKLNILTDEIVQSLNTFEDIMNGRLSPHIPHNQVSTAGEVSPQVFSIWMIEHSLQTPTVIFDAIYTASVFSAIMSWYKAVSQSEQPPVPKAAQPPEKQQKPRFRPKTKHKYSIALLVIFFLYCLISVFSSDGPPAAAGNGSVPADDPPAMLEATPAPSPSPTIGYISVPFPPHGTVELASGQAVDPYESAPFEIKTSSASRYYYIVLKSLSYPYVNCYIYLHGGEPAEVSVPLGSYEMYYACGDSWYGESVRFADTGGDFLAEDTFDFTSSGGYVYGYTVTLYDVYYGNLETSPVNAADFPE